MTGVTGNSTFDYDGTASYTGGTIYVNGQQASSIPNQMMGGRGGRGGFGGEFGNGYGREFGNGTGGESGTGTGTEPEGGWGGRGGGRGGRGGH